MSAPWGQGTWVWMLSQCRPPVSGWGSKFHAPYLPVHRECCSFTWSLLLEAKQRWARFTVGPEPGKRKWSPLGFAGKGRRYTELGEWDMQKTSQHALLVCLSLAYGQLFSSAVLAESLLESCSLQPHLLPHFTPYRHRLH